MFNERMSLIILKTKSLIMGCKYKYSMPISFSDNINHDLNSESNIILHTKVVYNNKSKLD